MRRPWVSFCLVSTQCLLSFCLHFAQFLLSFCSVSAQFLLSYCWISAEFLLSFCWVSAQFWLISAQFWLSFCSVSAHFRLSFFLVFPSIGFLPKKKRNIFSFSSKIGNFLSFKLDLKFAQWAAKRDQQIMEMRKWSCAINRKQVLSNISSPERAAI